MQESRKAQQDKDIAVGMTGAAAELMRDLEAPSWTARARAAERLATDFCAGALDDAARSAAEDGFRMLVHDSEVLVRRVLAECLKRAALPHDIAVALATDVPDVAVPLLEHSPALADDDLLRIMRLYPGEHRAAIARRRTVSEPVADALCRCAGEAVVAELLRNRGALVAARTLRWLIGRRADWQSVTAPAARRLAEVEPA
jgi:uncharacterized protein (DUF2336 family)